MCQTGAGLTTTVTLLQFIPMAVLYGVFLYMGVAALKGMQVNSCLTPRVLIILIYLFYEKKFDYIFTVEV